MTTPDLLTEIGLGGSYDWQVNGWQNSIYGEVNASRALSGGDLSALTGTVGLRVQW